MGLTLLGARLMLAQRLELFGGALVVILLAGEAWLLLHLLRQQGRLLVRVEALEALGAGTAAPVPAPGLPVGAPAPAFRLPDLQGQTVTLETLCGPGKRVLLLFSDPGCGPCTALLPELGRWQKEHANKMTIAVLSLVPPVAV